MPTFTPLDDQVLIRRAPHQELSVGGLHLPDRDKARPLQGTVLAVGPGRPVVCLCCDRVPVGVRPGDQVLHARYCGEELIIDGEECLVLRERDILGVIGD